MRRIGIGTRMAVSLALVGTQCLLAGAVHAEEAPGPLVLTGTVVGADDQPLSDATVAVHALDDRGREIRAVPLGRAESDASGHFEVRGVLRRRLARHPDGSVSLEVSVRTRAGAHKLFGLDARPPSTGRSTWKPVTDLADGLRQPRRPKARTGRSPGIRLSMAGAPSARTAPARRRCPLYAHYSWIPNGHVSRTRWVPVQPIRTRNHANQVYRWRTTRNTRMQVVYAGVGRNYAGGLTYAREHRSSAGARTHPMRSYWAGHVRTHWRYRQWKQICYNDTSPARIDTGRRKWVPQNWTGGFRQVADSSVGTWRCRKKWRTVIGGRLWAARRTTTRYNGQFTLAGVTVDSTQRNSRRHRLVITAHRGERARVCGSNADPIYAKRVIEGFL